MAKTLRVRTRTGWTTKPAPDLPENRLTAGEVDDTLLALEDAAAMRVAFVAQQEGQALPARPDATVVHWYSWTEPPLSAANPYDQWFMIPEINPAPPPEPPGLVTLFSDNFNRADQVLTTSADWEVFDTSPSLSLIGNQVGAASTNVSHMAKLSSATATTAGLIGGDQWAQMTLTTLTSHASTSFAEVSLHVDGNNHYRILLMNDASQVSSAALTSRAAGVSTNGPTITWNGAVPATVRIEKQGSELRAYLNGTLVSTMTPGDIGSTYRPALRIQAGVNGGVQDVRADDFSAGSWA